MRNRIKHRGLFAVLTAIALLWFIPSCGGGGGGGGEDGAGVSNNESCVRDWDCDGDDVPDELELIGYTYDDETNSFHLWDGDISKEYFKSDPHHWSTDGDPWSDGMEASKLSMDRSVLPPGDHPLIPGYPNFIVKLIDYTVALNSTITRTDGHEFNETTAWNRQTSATTSITNETRWNVNDELSCSLTDGFGAKVSVSLANSRSNTRTTGNVRSNGGSEMNSTQWSLSTCSNPSEAATIKLRLEVKNVGTFAARNVHLTMNLKIGEKFIQTITPEDVIARLDTESPFILVVPDIKLTFDELRSLETGATVSLELTQVTADVMKENAGQWELVGDWNDFLGTAKAVCAHVFLDLGDGNTIDQLIYADDSPTAPRVTLKDAIIWAAHGKDDPDDGPVVGFYQADGTLAEKPLDGWYFSLDATTYNRISDFKQRPDFNLFDTVLGPGSIVVAKAPPIEDWPKIRWAVKSQCEEKVKAYVDDYFFHQSLLEVTFVDGEGVEHPMTWDAENSYFYFELPFNYYGNYEDWPQEKIVARTPMYNPDMPGEWETEMASSNIGIDQCRFKDMEDGTVRDNDSGLFWLKTANCTEMDSIYNDAGTTTWLRAKNAAGTLAPPRCGLSDGSSKGMWRLPTIEEFEELGDSDYYRPALSNTRGDGQWADKDPFSINMHSFSEEDEFWTSSTKESTLCPNPKLLPVAWGAWSNDGNTYVDQCYDDQFRRRVWPVRGALEPGGD